MSGHSLNELIEQLGRSLCRCTGGQCDLLANDPGLCHALIRLLADGQPVSPDALARTCDRSEDDVLAVIRTSSNVELDDQCRIVGAGLSLTPTQHRLTLDGRTLYTWCALDALMYPPLLGMTVQVESPCAATGTPVRVQVSPDDVRAVTPADAVVSVVIPATAAGIRQGFCNDVHFYHSAHVAAPWLEQHPGALLLSVEEAYLLGRELTSTSSS